MKKTYTLKNKIRKLNFLGCMGLIAAILAGFILISTKIYIRQAVDFCDNVLTMNLNSLNNRLLQIQEGQYWITADPQIRNIIQYRIENAEVDYSVEVYHQREVQSQFQTLIRNREIENVYIVKPDGECLYSYKDAIYQDVFKNQEWFEKIKEKAEMQIAYVSILHDQSYYYSGGTPGLSVSMVMPFLKGVHSKSAPDAYLVCDIDLTELLAHNTKDIQFAIMDENKQWCTAEKIEGGGRIKDWAAEVYENRDAKIMQLEHKTLVMSMKTETFGIQMIGVKTLVELEDMQKQIFKLSAAVFCIAVLLSLVLSHSIMKIILKPIRRLMGKCDEVSKGNYEIEFDGEEAQEIAVLSSTIQGMIHNIVSLNQKMMEEEQLLSEQKLRAMQHQINPHFINNTLQSIKGLALQGETKKISDISTYLGKIMAYSVYRPYDTVTISKELEHVKNYLEIQKIRFDGMLYYSIECNAEVANVKTMKLILQPLVENAVEHGRESKNKQFISINADVEGEMACILINDNGKGLSEEELRKLEEKLESETSYEQETSIGLLNVNSRIKKKYGNQYGIEVKSKEGVGTTVIVKLSKECE